MIAGNNEKGFIEMHPIIKYNLDTKNLGLKIEPKGNENELWEAICFNNSSYAGDLVIRRSISGFIL